MKKAFAWLALMIITFSTSAQVTFPEKGISKKDNLHHLIKGATIHLEPGKTEVGDILIYKGRITAVGDVTEDAITANTVIYDRSEKHIYPSFIELNSDYGMEKTTDKKSKKGPQYEREENTSTYWNEAFHPEVDAFDGFKPNGKDSENLLKMGFGLALTHNHDGIGRGTSALVLIGEGEANEMMLDEKAAQHFSFSKGSSSQDYPSSLMGAIALIRQAFYDAQWYTAQQKETNVSLQALIDQKELPIIFEASEANDLIRIQRIAEEFDLKVIVSEPGDSYQVLNELSENITGVISSLDFPKPFDMSDPELSRYVSQSDLLHWERAPFNPRYISEVAMPFTLSGNGVEKEKEFFKNVRMAVEKGLPVEEALAALTTTPAEFLGTEKVGKLSPGYLANFFISDKEIFTEESPKVLEHWIKGKRNIISEVDVLTFEGNYDLNIDDTYYELSLKGEEKPKGKVSLIQDKDTLSSKVEFSSQGNEVVLAFDDPEGDGRFRLSATSLSDNRIWDGRGINPFGQEVLWSAIRTKTKTEGNKSETDTTATDSLLLPLPKMVYPLTAYGQDSLPVASSVLIQNATVWTLDEKGILEKADVLIANGKIKSVGSNLDLSEFEENTDLQIIDGTGMHITPGIIDEHSHIAITRGVNEGTQSSTAEVRIADAVSPNDINIYRQLAGGVTTSQLLHGSANPIGGQSALIKMRWGEDMNDMLFEEAPGFIKFALGENVKQSNWGDSYNKRYPQTRMGVEQFYYDSFYRAKEYGQLKQLNEAGKKAKKKRRRKKEKSEEKEVFRTDIELEALLEILNSERFITCHSYVQSEINMLMHVADSMGFTLNTFTHILEGYKVADKMKEHGAAASTFSDWWAYKFEVKDAIPHNASMLNRMGVTTAINSDDAEMGRRLNQEAAKGIRYGGMSEEDALKMVTLNPAKMLHIDKYVGSITPGKDADLVIWSDHPLSVYAKAMKTFVDGKIYFDRDDMELRKVRDEIERNEIAEKMAKAASNGSETKKPKRKMERYYHCDTKE